MGGERDEYYRQYYEANRERIKARSREYFRKNREKCLRLGERRRRARGIQPKEVIPPDVVAERRRERTRRYARARFARIMADPARAEAYRVQQRAKRKRQIQRRLRGD